VTLDLRKPGAGEDIRVALDKITIDKKK